MSRVKTAEPSGATLIWVLLSGLIALVAHLSPVLGYVGLTHNYVSF
jgi:hypothetical protein